MSEITVTEIFVVDDFALLCVCERNRVYLQQLQGDDKELKRLDNLDNHPGGAVAGFVAAARFLAKDSAAKSVTTNSGHEIRRIF